MEMLFSGGKLKISLNRHEMDELGLRYEDIDQRDETTKSALLFLMEKARDELGFSPRGAKLFIEVYPNSTEGGCVLLITAISRPSRLSDGQSGIEPVLFEFDDAETLIEGACKAFWRYSHRIYKSSLYRVNGKYRLIVYPLDYTDRLSVYFLSEFGGKIGEGEILAEYTREHGREIAADNALDIFAEYFGNG